MVKTYEISCPECNESFHVPHSPGKREGATMDCMMCDVTLIFQKRKVLNFHKWLHDETDGQWPEDGQGTHAVDIRPRTDNTDMPRKGEFIGE